MKKNEKDSESQAQAGEHQAEGEGMHDTLLRMWVISVETKMVVVYHLLQTGAGNIGLPCKKPD